jgi:hypothetical protein
MDVGHNAGDCASLAFRWFSAPCRSGQAVDHVLIDTVIGVEGMEQRLWQGKRRLSSFGHK